MNGGQAISVLSAALLVASAVRAADRDGERFFQQKIRPVLAENCYACHSRQSPKLEAGLRLDSREGILAGGNAGPAIVAGRPERSLMMRVLSHEDEVKMPPADKLAAGDIAANAGPAIVAGRPERSLMMRVLSHEDEVKMPPADKLAAGDIAAIERWIRMGAPMPESSLKSRLKLTGANTGRSCGQAARSRRPN